MLTMEERLLFFNAAVNVVSAVVTTALLVMFRTLQKYLAMLIEDEAKERNHQRRRSRIVNGRDLEDEDV